MDPLSLERHLSLRRYCISNNPTAFLVVYAWNLPKLSIRAEPFFYFQNLINKVLHIKTAIANIFRFEINIKKPNLLWPTCFKHRSDTLRIGSFTSSSAHVSKSDRHHKIFVHRVLHLISRSFDSPKNTTLWTRLWPYQLICSDIISKKVDLDHH